MWEANYNWVLGNETFEVPVGHPRLLAVNLPTRTMSPWI